ncbi:hypothetical protein NL676_000484 [Syzygium grande]|nr:hypothetical protein NL676_000484 [Syzygium grande]
MDDKQLVWMVVHGQGWLAMWTLTVKDAEILAELGAKLLLHGFVIKGNHNNRQGDLSDFPTRPKKPVDNSSWIQRILLTSLDPLNKKARSSV